MLTPAIELIEKQKYGAISEMCLVQSTCRFCVHSLTPSHTSGSVFHVKFTFKSGKCTSW